MQVTSYWLSASQQRIGRRRLLATTGAAGLAATLLAACGGKQKAAVETSSLITKKEDASGQAVRGGVYKTHITSNPASFDPYFRGVWFGTIGAAIYSRLAIVKPGMGMRSGGEIGGDLADSWEFAPDGLSATFRLRTNAHWAPTAPVNGREVDVQDIVTAWERWRSKSGVRATLDNAISPDGPIQSLTATDNRTVTLKLAFPAVTLPSLLSASLGQSFHILPKEADNGFDPQRVAIGSGPFYVSDFVSSAYIHMKRNPGYYDAQRPYFDAVEYPVITEYATGLAAFRSGQLYAYPVRAEEILTTKRDVTDLNVYTSDTQLPPAHIFFGYRNTEKGVFRDKRLRQAYSMSIDRDLFAKTWYNVDNFTSQGLPVDVAWSSAVAANEYLGWWLDPRDNNFGANGKFYKYDVAEAKKLVSAAGFPNGVSYISTRTSGQYGPDYDRQVEITQGMTAEAGFNAMPNVVSYDSELVPRYLGSRGDYEGLAFAQRTNSASDPIDKLAEWMSPGNGSNFLGFDTDGKGTSSGDPYIDDLFHRSKIEQDTQKRRAMMLDLQKHLADGMYFLRPYAGASSFELAWPAVRSYGFFQGDPREAANAAFYKWLDPSKKPVSS